MSDFVFDKLCSCGRIHKSASCEYTACKGAVDKIGEYSKKFNAKKAFVYGDINTYPIAGEKVCKILGECGIQPLSYVFSQKHTEPDETAVGSLFMHFDSECDIIVAIGSGVMNDLGKILSKHTSKPYIIVATAPSMDGYASATSSMAMDGVKVSLNTRCPDVIIGDTDILKTAPVHMIKSGLGDMIAKYTAICEWRIANLLTGEYYCEGVADFVRKSLEKCISNADGVLIKDDACIEAVFEGLIGCGSAMEYAGCSRPASGGEHYLSHIWDMRSLEFDTPMDLHGIQCAIGTLYSVKIYDKLKKYIPDKHKALEYVNNFDFEKWSRELEVFVGAGALPMIALEEKEQKYNKDMHKKRLEDIIDNWDKILDIINQEVPSSEELEEILDKIQSPKSVENIGMDLSVLPMSLKASKDIRDKYVLPRLLWDLGILDEVSNDLK